MNFEPLMESMRMSSKSRALLAATFASTIVAFIGLIVYASLDGSVVAGLREVLSTRWGQVTLADLGIGLLFASAWMGAVVGPKRALPWIVGLWLLGNLVLAAFLLVRVRKARGVREVFLGEATQRA